MDALLELKQFYERIILYKTLVNEYATTFFPSKDTKDNLQKLRTELQRSYSQLESKITRYAGSSSVADPCAGKQDVFDIAFGPIGFFNFSKNQEALHSVVKIVNTAIGKLQAEGQSWKADSPEGEKTNLGGVISKDMTQASIKIDGKGSEEIIGELKSGILLEAPVELKQSLANFRRDHPYPEKVAFIMMQFGKRQAYRKIAEAIKKALHSYGVKGVRADDKQYHDDLYYNVLTYLHGCGFGIGVFEQIEGAMTFPRY